MFANEIAEALTYFLAMLFALTFHEAAHAYTAHLLGDDTAKRDGRLSLNPAVHADMIGTIVLPLAGLLLHWPLFGYAKPVPVDERYFKNPTRDSFLVAIAGPMSNFLMVLIGTVILRSYYLYGTGILPADSFLFPLVKLASAFVFISAVLGLFNLIPLPPLDGAQILRVVLPRDIYESYEQVATSYGLIILIVLFMSGALNWIGGMSRVIVRFAELLVSFVLPG